MAFLAFFEPIFYAVNPTFLWSKRQRFCIKKRSDGLAANLTQKEANKAFEGPSLIFAEQVGNAIALLTTALMYILILPIGVVLAMIGLTLYYWALKIKLLRHHRIPEQLSELSVMSIVNLFPWLVFGTTLFFYVQIAVIVEYMELFVQPQKPMNT